METVQPEEQSATGPVVCELCGAALEVRVRFRGTVVWTVERDHPEFGDREPELRGNHGEPRLVCSADVMHKTGFQLIEGKIIRGTPKDSKD